MSDFDDKTPAHLRDRVRIALIEDRLSDGAKTFASIRRMVWGVVALAVGSLGTVIVIAFRTGGFVEQATDTRATVRDVQHDVSAVKSEVRDLDRKQFKLGVEVEKVRSSTERIEEALTRPDRDPLGRRRRR